jgi:Cytochrome c oxidase subunit IV
MSNPTPFRSTETYPQWLKTLDKGEISLYNSCSFLLSSIASRFSRGLTLACSSAPKSKVILGSILLAAGISGMASVLLASGGEVVPTMNTDWKNATKEYMKFQKMNPIFGKANP